MEKNQYFSYSIAIGKQIKKSVALPFNYVGRHAILCKIKKKQALKRIEVFETKIQNFDLVYSDMKFL